MNEPKVVTLRKIRNSSERKRNATVDEYRKNILTQNIKRLNRQIIALEEQEKETKESA